MGLGVDRSLCEDYEWFVPSEVRLEPVSNMAGAVDALARRPPWTRAGGVRVLLVDLDNLRVESARLQGRISLAVTLARQADLAAFAGQRGAVGRARPWLEEFRSAAVAVGGGHDEADEALLAAADAVGDDAVQFVVISNDGIFAQLAMRGPLTVISPGAGALSDRLSAVAERVVDMQQLESGDAAWPY